MITEEQKQYLDSLRDSGVTNMLATTPYIQKVFKVSNKKAKIILVEWIKTYGEKNENKV